MTQEEKEAVLAELTNFILNYKPTQYAKDTKDKEFMIEYISRDLSTKVYDVTNNLLEGMRNP